MKNKCDWPSSNWNSGFIHVDFFVNFSSSKATNLTEGEICLVSNFSKKKSMSCFPKKKKQKKLDLLSFFPKRKFTYLKLLFRFLEALKCQNSNGWAPPEVFSFFILHFWWKLFIDQKRQEFLFSRMGTKLFFLKVFYLRWFQKRF